ncbi:hypothetical protein J2T12_002150 [Paenibacillus anaericanus]|uniref:hypothetical protein n=1 Tax=Paenibacillus anaericanus TaxID=170367 RepID=UPI002788D023|nr:hypothetical protein [Paenibacillus anaericanus]MDQ0088740.1 hypothetical protein [Paenibacillus anaericanus]
MKKGYFYIAAILVALLLLPFHHLGYSLGDSIFKAVGLSPWSKINNTGFHLPAIIGILLLIVGTSGTVKFYKPKYPKILRRIIIGCCVFFIVVPYVSEGTMYLLKHNSNEIDSIDVADLKCRYKTDEGNSVIADCTFELYNYGKAEKISLKPVLNNEFKQFEFQSNTLSLDSHSKLNMSMQFNGIQKDESVVVSGSLGEVYLDLEIIE